ncbi:MAG: DUF2853 family protein [Saprospiraceae bacterium]|nr:DUF2853 family protein [Saprospiraceae bacterium]
MSKFDEKVKEALDSAKTMGIKVNGSLLEKVAKGLGPSIYRADSALVAVSDKTEMERVKKSFCEGKLGSKDDAKNTAAIASAAKAFGSNRKKLRIIFYTLIVESLGKSSVYK